MQKVPDGYMEDAKGNLVPNSNIKEIDLMRDSLVKEIVNEAINLNEILKAFKSNIFGNIAAFVQLSGEQYGAKLGGNKGNVTLTSFDGRYKIQRAYAENLTFDERLQAAKALIDECIADWSENVNNNIRVLVNGAFEVNQEGKISTTKVLSLRQYKIDDEKWQQAMQAIADSLRVSGTKAYVRIYERDDDSGEYHPISLDVASA